MTKNTLLDFNNHLFEQLERLSDESLTDEQLEKELKRTDAIVDLGDIIVRNGELAFKTMEHMDKYGYSSDKRAAPAMLTYKEEGKD